MSADGTAAGHRSGSWAGTGLRIALALLSLAVVVGSGVAWASYRSFESNIVRIDLGAGSSKVKNIDGADQNILIVGNDDRDGLTPAQLRVLNTTSDGGSENTDTMMLLHVPANGSKATVISFPRDSYVAIPGHGMDKLNSAFTHGITDGHGSKKAGAALLKATIENLTGLNIDHYVQVDLFGFYTISEAVDGVTVCLNNAMRPAKTTRDIGPGFDSGFENSAFVRSYSGINLPKGTSTIKGTQALAFVRQRHGLPNGDLDRIKRQQYFLAAVFRKVSSAGTLSNPLRLERLLKAVSSSLTLDTALDPLKLLQQMQNLTAGHVIFTTIPLAADKYATLPGVGSVVQLDTAAIPNFIDTLIGQDPAVALAKAKPAAPGSFPIDVLNASGIAGRASSNAAALTALGFRPVIGAGTPAVQAPTMILYPAGMEGAAKSLATEVPGASLLRSAAVTEVTLYLGSSGVEVKTLAPPSPPMKPGAPSMPTTSPIPTPTLPPGTTTAATAGCVD